MKVIEDLINFLSSFPSIGRRSAAKIAIEMCQNKDRLMLDFGRQIQELGMSISTCSACFNIDVQNPCKICNDSSRDKTKICLVDTVADLWNVEKTSFYDGLYFIINSNRIGHKDFEETLQILQQRINNIHLNNSLQEIIIANNTSLDGQTFIFYVTDVLNSLKTDKGYNFTITTLAKGVPSGSNIEYLDEKTILMALKDRREV